MLNTYHSSEQYSIIIIILVSLSFCDMPLILLAFKVRITNVQRCWSIKCVSECSDILFDTVMDDRKSPPTHSLDPGLHDECTFLIKDGGRETRMEKHSARQSRA